MKITHYVSAEESGCLTTFFYVDGSDSLTAFLSLAVPLIKSGKLPYGSTCFMEDDPEGEILVSLNNTDEDLSISLKSGHQEFFNMNLNLNGILLLKSQKDDSVTLIMSREEIEGFTAQLSHAMFSAKDNRAANVISTSTWKAIIVGISVITSALLILTFPLNG